MSAVLNIPTDQEIEEFVRADPSQDENATHERELELKGLAAYQRQQAQKISASRRDLDRELDRQSTKLFTAESFVESVAEALDARFGPDWPADVPNYGRVLREAARHIRDAYENLEIAALENNIAARREH